MTNFSDMLSKAKAMQEKMKEAQDQIKKIEVEGEAGGNLVKVILSGDYELKSIGKFSPPVTFESSSADFFFKFSLALLYAAIIKSFIIS